MNRNTRLAAFGWLAMALGAFAQIAWAKEASASKRSATSTAAASSAVEFFEAVDAGQINAKFIAMNDHAARLIITNNTNQPLNLKLPEAFAGVPVAAQFGGAGGGAGRVGGGGRSTTTGGGAQQSVGGGLGGGGGGGLGGGGGGGGFFSVPPERSEKLDFAVLCLNHGLRDPSSSTAYKIVPADSVLRPAVVELLKAFGRGELKHAGAQAAAWHLNNDLSWNQLAAQLQGTRRSFRRPPYFSADEIRAGMAYADAATRIAEANTDQYNRAKKEKAKKPSKLEDSDTLSTTDTPTIEPPKTDTAESKDGKNVSSDEKK
jgi:hypothetical protein